MAIYHTRICASIGGFSLSRGVVMIPDTMMQFCRLVTASSDSSLKVICRVILTLAHHPLFATHIGTAVYITILSHIVCHPHKYYRIHHYSFTRLLKTTALSQRKRTVTRRSKHFPCFKSSLIKNSLSNKYS